MAHLYYCILRMKMAWEGRRRTRPAGDGAGAAARHCTAAAGVHKPNGFVICMFIGGGRNLHSRISCERGRFVFVRRKRHGMEPKVVDIKYSKYLLYELA